MKQTFIPLLILSPLWAILLFPPHWRAFDSLFFFLGAAYLISVAGLFKRRRWD